MRTTLLLAAVAAVIAGCSGAQGQRSGGVSVTASPLALPSQVEQVTITATPGGYTATLTRNLATGQYEGSLFLPPGAYTLQAAAYGDTNGDGIPELIGTGTTSVVVYQNQTTAAVIRIVDVTGPPPAPDHGPIITSVTMSNVFGVVSRPLSFSATAVDVDGDPIAYAWTETCSSGAPSAFSAPSAARTDWTPAAAGICTIRVAATSNGLADAAVFELPVYTTGPEGIVQVTAYFVSSPAVESVAFDGDDVAGAHFQWTADRVRSDATLPYDVAPGGIVRVEVRSVSPSPGETITISDDCGGTLVELSRAAGWLAGSWYAPAAPAICMISGAVARDGLSDTLPIAVNVGSPFTYAVTGTVSGAGAGVTITLSETGRATTTDAAGAYAFRGLANGTYTLTPSLAGFGFRPASRSVTVSGTNVVGQDFTAAPIVLAPSSGQASYVKTFVPVPGFLARGGELVRLDADTHQGSAVAADGVYPFGWSSDGADVVLSYGAVRRSFTDCPSIRTSPAPIDVQNGYIAENATEQICVQVEITGNRFHPLTQQGTAYRVEDVETQHLFWGPFSVGGVTYQYESDRAVSSPTDLRARGAAPAVPFTPALASGSTWALYVRYSAGTDYYSGEVLPPAFNADLVTFQPGGVASPRYAAGSVLWNLNGGYLGLLFADGSTETLEIVDSSGALWGLWAEHRDAGGTLVAGTYDWAIRTDVLPAATVPFFASQGGDYWQTLINAAYPATWGPDGDLLWESHFGWQLLPDGTGSNLSAYLDTTPDGTTTPVLSLLPILWSVTTDGRVFLDRYRFSTGENRSYRLLTPIVLAADGNGAYVIEEEHRRASPTSPYGTLIAPRLNSYVRWPMPAPGSPAAP